MSVAFQRFAPSETTIDASTRVIVSAPPSKGRWIFTPLLTTLLFATLPGESVRGGDWPQVLGPNRDGHAEGESVAPWKGNLKIRWRVSCGAGYAGVAVAGQRVFVWHREGDSELLDCLNATDGKRLWRQTFDAYYRGGVDPDVGPRCVPVVSGDRVVVYGAGGDLHAVSVSDGAKLWSRSLQEDFNADEGYFGAGSTPLVITNRDLDKETDVETQTPSFGKEMVIVEAGGRTGAGLVGLNLADGKTLWKTLDSEAAYASPVLITVAGKKLVAALMRLSLVLVDPQSGKVETEVPFGKRGPTVNAATPIVEDQQILLTASYGIGCKKIRVGLGNSESLWSNDDVISSQYVTPVKIDNYLYAVTGREDMGTPALCCVDWETGQQKWIKSDYGTAHLIAMGHYLLVQNVDGRVDLITATADACNVLASSPLPDGTYRSLPAVANGQLFVRRSQTPRSGEILAIEIPQ